MSTNYPNLLRRTIYAAGASLLLGGSLPAASQGTVTLSGTTGNTCSYTQMTVQPNGSIQVTCSGQTNPNPTDPAQTSFSATMPASGAPNSEQSLTVRRAATGNVTYVNVNWSYSGSCTPNSGYAQNNVVLTSGAEWTEKFTLGASGTCTVTLSAASPHTVTHGSTTITTSGGGGGDPPPPTGGLPQVPGCPAPEATAGRHDLAFGPVHQLRLKSGVIATYPVIPQPQEGNRASVEFTQGQQPNTPGSLVTEYSVSRCPGVILSNVPDCYYKSSFVNLNKIVIYTKTKPEWGWVDQASMQGLGCLADAAQGQWYVNVRWTYPVCPWGENQCGFSMQWALGAW